MRGARRLLPLACSGTRLAALLLVLAVVAGASARAQDRAQARSQTKPVSSVEYVPREEMIDAILQYAASGGCDAQRKIFGTAFDAACGTPDSGTSLVAMWTALDRLPDRELAGLCRQNQIADCEASREQSKGRTVLTFESAFDVDFHSYRATWSPEGRFLLLDSLDLPAQEVRILDVAAGKLLSPPLHAGPIHDAAWSPDGTYIALSDRRRVSPEVPPPVGTVRLYAAGTRKAQARISVADIGCSLSLLEGMAFTADSRSLWVLCSQADKTAKAVRLRVPDLKVEDSFVPVSPIPGWSESYWEEKIVRFADDLIVTVRFASPTPVKGPRSAVQSYRLGSPQPLYGPMHVGAARLAPDLSGLYVGNELWSTQTGQRVATGIKPDGRYLGAPNRLPQLRLHIEARPQPRSRRSMLAVVDSATGATVQEIGPVPAPPVSILVSPNGARVAVAGFQGIRFYRVHRGPTLGQARRTQVEAGPQVDHTGH